MPYSYNIMSSKNTPVAHSPSPPDSMESFGSHVPYAEPLWYSRNVSPHYTDSHRILRAAVRKYVDEELLPYAFEWETAGVVPDHVSKAKRCKYLKSSDINFRFGKDTPS